MNFYKCVTLNNLTDSAEVANIYYTWADSEVQAKSEYIKTFGYRKNKKGIIITQIEYFKGYRKPQVIDELITYKVDDKGRQHKALTKVSRICCSRCGRVASNISFCTFCDAQFK